MHACALNRDRRACGGLWRTAPVRRLPGPAPGWSGGNDRGPLACTLHRRFRGHSWFLNVEECELLHLDVTLLRKAGGRRCLAENPLVRQVFAHRGNTAHVEVTFEVVLDLAGASRFADL